MPGAGDGRGNISGGATRRMQLGDPPGDGMVLHLGRGGGYMNVPRGKIAQNQVHLTVPCYGLLRPPQVHMLTPSPQGDVSEVRPLRSGEIKRVEPSC